MSCPAPRTMTPHPRNPWSPPADGGKYSSIHMRTGGITASSKGRGATKSSTRRGSIGTDGKSAVTTPSSRVIVWPSPHDTDSPLTSRASRRSRQSGVGAVAPRRCRIRAGVPRAYGAALSRARVSATRSGPLNEAVNAAMAETHRDHSKRRTAVDHQARPAQPREAVRARTAVNRRVPSAIRAAAPVCDGDARKPCRRRSARCAQLERCGRFGLDGERRARVTARAPGLGLRVGGRRDGGGEGDHGAWVSRRAARRAASAALAPRGKRLTYWRASESASAVWPS